MQFQRHLLTLLFFLTILFSTSLMAVSLPLKSGWNLVGMDTTMSLSQLQLKVGTDNLEVIQGPTQTYQKKYIELDLAFLNDFTSFEKGVGYWIQLQHDVTIEYTLETYVGEESIALNRGWNLINPLANFTLEEILAQLGVQNILVIQGSVKTYQKHYIDDNKSFLNDFTLFETGHGYWIKLAEPATLHYLFDLTQHALNNIGALVAYNMTLGTNVYTIKVYSSQVPISTNSQSTIAVYGTLNGESTESNIKLNNTYPTDTQFQIKIFDSNGTLVGQSAILAYNANTINFGALTVENLTVEPPSTTPPQTDAESVAQGACQVDYHVRDEWSNGATVDVTVTNQMGNLYGWEVTFTFPSGQTTNNLWNGIETQTNNFMRVLNESYNAQINQGQKIEFGFVLNHNGTNGIPTDIRLNGTLCDGQTGGIIKPEKPTNLVANLVNNNQVTLTWSDNSDNEDNFLLYKSVDLNSWELLTSLASNVTTYQESGLEVGHRYQYKVQAKNIAGKTESDTVTVIPDIRYIKDGVDNKAISLVVNCTTCHRSGNSDGSIPVIDGLNKEYLVSVLKSYQNGTHFGYAMPRIIEGYSDDEVARMAEYYANKSWVGNKAVSYDINTIESGKALYETNCKVCHGEDAKGAVAKVDISSQSENYLVDTMMQYAKGLHINGNAGMRSTFTDTIGQDESKIKSIAKYLAVGLEIPQGDNNTIRGFNAY